MKWGWGGGGDDSRKFFITEGSRCNTKKGEGNTKKKNKKLRYKITSLDCSKPKTKSAYNAQPFSQQHERKLETGKKGYWAEA